MNLVLKINEIIKELGYDETPEVSVSNRPDISDYQYNGAFKLAKIMHKSPMVIADEIVSKLKDNDMFKEVSNVNGFINITLSDKALIDYLNEIVNNFDINTFKINTDETIFLDYGGANVAKALHAGHLRSPNIGEALKRLCEAVGYKTISDVHYGDWGRPMGLIICEIKHRYPNLDFFNPNLDSYPKESPVTLEDLYTIYPLASAKSKEDEEYLNEARELTVKLQKKEKGIYDLYKAFTKLSILDIEDIYKKLNCTFDLYEGERDADDYIQDVLTVTKPFTTISNGATIIDVKEETDKKEIPPVMLLKSDGGVLYDTTELATLYSRIKRFKASKYFYLTDVRQELHFVEAFRAAYKTGIVPKDISLEWFGFGTLNGPDGKPFKTRDGGIMSLRELISIVKTETRKVIKDNIKEEDKDDLAEVLAIAAIKYADLLPNRTSDYVFDPIKFSDINGKTGPYILYSTVRMKSLLSKSNLKYNKYYKINTKEERDILINIIKLRSVIEKSFNMRSLNEICEYIYKLTSSFNAFYSNHEVLTEQDELVKESYLTLINEVYIINKYLLNILAITLPDKI
ncbi:MAG: arginine--tRNA ligase [Tenericutes bacterium]|nr:arginine--tRNA ligase [Mycoplasmatota bacterium]